jgi:predicted transporter
MSFKLVNIFGIDINLGIIFSSGLLVILYYFVNRYGKGEDKKLITTIGVSTILLGIILLLNTFIVPSLGDKNSIIYQELILNNLPILILYPISLIGTLLFSSYTFNELKKENGKRLIT